ncbi:MAG TPA: SirB2 family protein [Burkholderiaceae bacterium]|nr:SirB2 family protein [Burkholderiaceae bacterium]
MTYYAIKHLHVTSAVLSILFFMIRAWWSVTENALLQTRLVRVLPHIIDTILLVCGVLLAIWIGPWQAWIGAKIIALLLYIAIGMVAIRRGRTPHARALAAVVAVLIFFYIVGVALTHNPWSWMA